MVSLLKILFITVCSILAGIVIFCGIGANPSSLTDPSFLTTCLFMAVVGLIVFSVPTAIAVGIGWKIYQAGSSWRNRLFLYLCLGVLGSVFTQSILYADTHDTFSRYLILGGAVGGLVAAFLIIRLKRPEE